MGLWIGQCSDIGREIDTDLFHLDCTKFVSLTDFKIKSGGPLLWEYLLDLLGNPEYCPKVIQWTNKPERIFKIVDVDAVSRLWGKIKRKPNMTYEHLARALRFYYPRGILRKAGERYHYQFLTVPNQEKIHFNLKKNLSPSALDNVSIACDKKESYEIKTEIIDLD